MRFANREMLWLLLVTVPLLVWFLCWAWRRKQTLIAQFVQSRLLAQLTVGVSPLRQKIRLALVILAVICALLALARPQWGFDWEEARQRGLDIVVAIDTSRSMLAEDVRPNRLSRARLAALDLMKLAKSDRLALVPFAGTAFLQCPLTLDEQAFRQSLEALEVGIIPQGGTALTEAIEAALSAYKEAGDNFKILVLFTDGEDHDSGALGAAEKAAKAGLRIFTVGVGTPNGELLRVTDESGAASYIKDEQGNVVKSRLNETLLQQIASATGGFYLPLRGANAVETLYEKGLAPLPKSESSARLVRNYHERYQWPLALAIAALVAEMLLPDRKRASRAEPPPRAVHAELRKAVATLLILTLSAAALASPSSARRLYESARYKEAQREYERLLQKEGDEKAPDFKAAQEKNEAGKDQEAWKEVTRSLADARVGDPRLHFNAGTAAYKAGDLENAAKHLAFSLTSPDLALQQRAYYNLGNTLYRDGEQDQETNQKIEKWGAALQSYDSALALDPQDADAKYNLEFVQKKLEELKKQQQDQKQDQKDQENQDRQKKDQKQDQQQPPDSSKQQQQQKQQSKPDSKPQDQQQPSPSQPENADNQKQKEQEQAKQNKPRGSDRGEEKQGDQSEATVEPRAGQMTVQEAQQLLDSQKGEERAMIFVPAQKLKEQRRVFKDW